MSPVDLASKRREADRRELERAKAEGDWGAGLDVIRANLHEIESLVIRSLAKHDTTHDELAALRALIEGMLERVGELVTTIEQKPAAPSYRPSLASANNLDAQAIGQTIEGVYAELHGSQLAIATRVVALESTIGVVPDEIKGTNGTGLAGIVHKLNSKTTLAKLALLAAVASALGTNVGEFVRWLLHLASKG